MKEKSFSKFMKNKLLIDAVFITIAITAILLIRHFNVLGEKTSLLMVIVVMATVAVFSYICERRGKEYWQIKCLKESGKLKKYRNIWLAIVYVLLIIFLFMPDNSYLYNYGCDIVLNLIILSQYGFEVYEYLLVKKYNMEDFETREEFEEKYQL